MATEKDVIKSEQLRLLATNTEGVRVNVFGGALYYSMETMEVGYARHKEMGSNPTIQRRSVVVTYEYGEWGDVK